MRNVLVITMVALALGPVSLASAQHRYRPSRAPELELLDSADLEAARSGASAEVAGGAALVVLGGLAVVGAIAMLVASPIHATRREPSSDSSGWGDWPDFYPSSPPSYTPPCTPRTVTVGNDAGLFGGGIASLVGGLALALGGGLGVILPANRRLRMIQRELRRREQVMPSFSLSASPEGATLFLRGAF